MILRKVFCTALILGYILPIHCQTVKTNKPGFVGKVYTQISEIEELKKFKEQDAVVIEPSINRFSFSKISDGKITYILFNSFVRPNSRRIVAFLNIDKIDKGNKIVMARCRLNSKIDDFIVAIVKPTKSDFFKNIIKAWRINERTAQFVNISNKGLDCLNDAEETF